MTKQFEIKYSNNPQFQTVTGLTNTTFNPNSITEGKMATETQIEQLYKDIVAAEQRADYCCRDIIVWEARTQVVRLNSNTMYPRYNAGNEGSTYFGFNAGGIVVSNFDKNVNIGTMRRGLVYTVEFPLKWDDELYFPYNAMQTGGTNAVIYPNSNSSVPSQTSSYKGNPLTHVEYRYTEDKSFEVYGTPSSTNNNRAYFFGNLQTNASCGNDPGGGNSGYPSNIYSAPCSNDRLTRINITDNWYSFIRDIKDDGTVTLKDNRRNTNYNIIRFYTQWTLDRCADGTLLSDAAKTRLAEWNENHPDDQMVMGRDIYLR